MKKNLTILGIVLIVLAGVTGKFVIKPNPQKLAQEIVDNLRTIWVIVS